MLFGGVECCHLLYFQGGIQFIFHLSTINDLVLAYLSQNFLCQAVCSLHRALWSLIPRETSCIKPDDSRPFMGVSTKVPIRVICFPLKSAVVLTFSHSGHAADSMHLQKPLSPGVCLCPHYSSVWPHSGIYCSLSYKPLCCSSFPSTQLKFYLFGF